MAIHNCVSKFLMVFGAISLVFLMWVGGVTIYARYARPVTYKEQGRVISPDHRYEAVIIDRKPSAWPGSPQSFVYIVPTGESFKLGRGGFELETFDGYDVKTEDLEWIGSTELRINYSSERPIEFFQPWYTTGKAKVTVQLDILQNLW